MKLSELQAAQALLEQLYTEAVLIVQREREFSIEPTFKDLIEGHQGSDRFGYYPQWHYAESKILSALYRRLSTLFRTIYIQFDSGCPTINRSNSRTS
jgi:hypothetical protein